MIRRRGINRGLEELLASQSSSKDVVTDTRPIQTNIFCIAVIRTKGGSGEKHVVKNEKKAFNDQGRNVLIVKLNSDITVENEGHHKVYGCELTLQQVKDGCSNGQLVLDWTNQDKLNELFEAITSSETICIFTVGTDSGGKLWKRISSIKRYCSKIILSVNLEVMNSIQPAIRVIREYLPLNPDIENKLVIGAFDKSKKLNRFTPEMFINDMTTQGYDYN